jgi:signal transduction histidine kinase
MRAASGRSELAVATSGPPPAASQGAAASLAAYLAHELRTPLATQRALLELALADPGIDIAAWREIAREVLDASRQQERVLEACLALGRSQAGLGECESVDLSSLVAALLRTTDLEGLNARVRLEPARTTGVPSLLERLFDNLLANAVRHNRPGGWIAITLRRRGSQALFAIENPGRRIPASELGRLFEPFRQLPSQGGRDTGLGLGLAVVTAVADAHAALVTASARVGGGLRVEVAFAPTRGSRAVA